MDKKSIEFLKELQSEMLTQSEILTQGTSNLRFWVVTDERKIYSEDDYDGQEIIFEGDVIGENLKDLCDFLVDYDDKIRISYNKENDYVEFLDKDGHKTTLFEVEGLVDYLNNELDYDIYLNNYKIEEIIVPNTMFLTLRECREHIKSNEHHYNKPSAYGMSAEKSSQAKQLYNILLKTNWDEVK